MRLLRSLVAVLLLGLVCTGASAQTPDALSLLLGRGSGLEASTGSAALLEGPLDPAAYVVGPGDVFAIAVGGTQGQVLRAAVTADGQLLLAEVGGVQVAGLPLRQALERLEARLRLLYPRVPVHAALAEPRRFFVHVTGAVPAPGRKAVGPVARLEDALAAASIADSLTLATYLPSALIPALRAVEVVRSSGDRRSYDLVRYRRTGDLAHNPYLQDGDRIYVPKVRVSDEAVLISGDVAAPGPYALHGDGDTALDLLIAADGMPSPTDTRTLRVRGDGSYALSELIANPERAPRLTAGAQVFVEQAAVAGLVQVTGAVRFPGAYRIVPGVTSLRELVEEAGGLLDYALPRAAYLQRYGDADPRAFSSAVRTLVVPGDLPFVERTALGDQFYQSALAIPVGAILSGDASDVKLYAGDQIIIPRDEQSVLVIGAVARPGYVPLLDGAGPPAYLAAVGGLRAQARSVFVLNALTRTLQPAGSAPLASGDVLVVTTDDAATRPELYAFSLQEQQLALQERNAKRDARFRVLSTSLSVISTAVAVITTYLTVRELNR